MSKAKKAVEKVEVKVQKQRGANVDSKTSRQNLAFRMFDAKVKRVKAMSKPEEV